MAAILQQRCSAQSILIIADDYTPRACHFTREDLSLQGISGTCSRKFSCLCGHCVSVPVTFFPYMLVLDVLVCVLQMVLSRCSSLQQDPLCFSIFKCCKKFLCTDCYTKGLPQRTQHFKSKFCDTVAHNMLHTFGDPVTLCCKMLEVQQDGRTCVTCSVLQCGNVLRYNVACFWPGFNTEVRKSRLQLTSCSCIMIYLQCREKAQCLKPLLSVI